MNGSERVFMRLHTKRIDLDSFEETEGIQLRINDLNDIEHVDLLIRPSYGYYANQEWS